MSKLTYPIDKDSYAHSYDLNELSYVMNKYNFVVTSEIMQF